MSTEHSKRAAKFTQNVEKTTWHDATFWSVRQKRDKMAQELPEWEDLREHASEIKMHTITHLADYLDMFSKNLESRGVKVHWAKDAQEFNEIVLGILKDHNVKKMVKSKSMLSLFHKTILLHQPLRRLLMLPMLRKFRFIHALIQW